jgi:hypothetical protein
MKFDAKAFISEHRTLLVAFVVYLFIAFLRFPNIALNITTTIPGANGDAYQNLWGMWWVVYSLFHLHTNMYYTDLLFWPIGANLIYQTMSPLGSIITAPLQAISMPLAYNALFFVGFPLSALGMFILADYTVSNKKAAFVAGLIYSFSAIHIMQAYSRIDWMVIGWMPLSLYFLLKMIREERNYYNVIGFSLSFILGIFIGDIEQGIMALMLYLFLIIAYLIHSKTRNRILTRTVLSQLALSVAIIFVVGSVEFIPIVLSLLAKPNPNPANLNLISVVNQLNNIPFNIQNSLDVFSFFLPDFYKGLVPDAIFFSYYWKIFSIASIEKTGYLTYTAIVLSLLGVIKNRRSSTLWVGLALVFGLLSLGPYLTVAGISVKIPLPYLIYHSIPLVNIVREPDRFIDVFLIAFAILASYGYIAVENFVYKTKRAGRLSNRYFAIIMISLLLLLETSGAPITNSSGILPITTKPQIPQFYYDIRNLTGNFSVLQLPALPSASGPSQLYPAEAQYYSSASMKPLVGGYLTRTNYTEYAYLYYVPIVVMAANLEDYGRPSYSSPIVENYTNQTLLFLYSFRTSFVVLETQAYTEGEFGFIYSYLESTFGAPVYSSNSTIAFSTSNAIRKSLYRSFVSFPVLDDWKYIPMEYNGNEVGVWSPINQGQIVIYAPYNSSVTSSSYNRTAYVNATLRFDAFTYYPVEEKLDIGEQAGVKSTVIVGTLNITPTLRSYAVQLPDLAAGEIGNDAMFIQNISRYSSPQNGTLLITNITISG